MSMLLTKLRENRSNLINQAQEIAQRAVTENRNLTSAEASTFDGLIASGEDLGRRADELAAGEQRARDIDASFTPSNSRNYGEGAFGTWARSAIPGGPGFDIVRVNGAERDALTAWRSGSMQERAMVANGGTGKNGVYGTVWEYAVATSQLLQAGTEVIATSDGNPLPLPVVTGHATAASAAANDPITASDAGITTVDLTVTKRGYLTLVPTELTQDATFDLEGYLARAAGRELGNQITQIASTALVAGFTVSGATAPTASVAATGSVFSDALVTLFHSVGVPYRGVNSSFLLSDPTAASIRKIKDAQGRYTWTDALIAGDPDRILGKSVYIDPNLPSPAGTSKIVYFGDFSALKVRIAGGIRFERSTDYAFGNDQIAYRALVRTGAVTVDPNAVKFLQLTAS